MTSKALPVTVPEGTIADELANLSGDFSLEVANVEPDELWEYINKATDRVFGYGMGTQELSALIRRGQYGMDGVCDWLERAVIKLARIFQMSMVATSHSIKISILSATRSLFL
jgi:hypothetical protein